MTNKQEQGRSMVEMLGVLAVVGVLSAGGIAGYTYAMDRHRTNELLNEASKRAVVVASQIASGRPVSLAEFGTGETAGGKIEADVVELEGEFGFKVTDVKESVCENIVKMVDESSAFIQDITRLNDYNTLFTIEDCSGDNNSFMLIFNGDVGENTSNNSESRCKPSEKVEKTYQGGFCCDKTLTRKLCPDEEPPTCIKDSTCECTDEECCDEIDGRWVTTEGITGSCCPADMGGSCSFSDDGPCTCIPDNQDWECGQEDCITCPEGEEALCSWFGECICALRGTGDCGADSDTCIVCETGTALCSVYDECICVPNGYDSNCGDYECIACSPTEGRALCSVDGECICVPDGYSSDCGDQNCRACSPEEGTALCPDDYAGSCICVPKGYGSKCNDYSCIACSSSEGTPLCSEEGTCICEPEGYSSLCNEENCVACPSGQTPTCEGDYGDCSCIYECDETTKPTNGDAWTCDITNGSWKCNGNECEYGPDAGKCMNYCSCDAAPDSFDGWYCDNETGELFCENECSDGLNKGECSWDCPCLGTPPSEGDAWECYTEDGVWECGENICKAGPDVGKCQWPCECDSGCSNCRDWTGECLD